MFLLLLFAFFVLTIWLVSGILLVYFTANRNGNVERLLKANEPSVDVPKHIVDLRNTIDDLIDEEYEITNGDGIKLHGYLIRSKKGSNVYVFYNHGYRSPDGGKEFGYIYPLWEKYDFNCFFVDHRAHANSGGTHITYGIRESNDNMEWLYFLKNQFGENIQIILHGQSMGGAVVLMMSGKELPDQVRFILADCGYSSWFDEGLHVLRFPGSRLIMEAANLYQRMIYRIDIKKASPREAVKKSKTPILFIHGEKDSFVPCCMGRENYEACASEKEFHVFPGAEHATSLLVDPEKYARLVDRFVGKYVTL